MKTEEAMQYIRCVSVGCFRAHGRDVAQPGSAPEWGSEGREFKSHRPDHLVFHKLIQYQPHAGKSASDSRNAQYWGCRSKTDQGNRRLSPTFCEASLCCPNRDWTERLKAQEYNIIGRKMGGRKMRLEWAIDVKRISDCLVLAGSSRWQQACLD